MTEDEAKYVTELEDALEDYITSSRGVIMILECMWEDLIMKGISIDVKQHGKVYNIGHVQEELTKLKQKYSKLLKKDEDV